MGRGGAIGDYLLQDFSILPAQGVMGMGWAGCGMWDGWGMGWGTGWWHIWWDMLDMVLLVTRPPLGHTRFVLCWAYWHLVSLSLRLVSLFLGWAM